MDYLQGGALRRLRSVVVPMMAGIVVWSGTGSAWAVVYTNVTAAAGINYLQNQGFGAGQLFMTGGAAAGDFDNDGWVDLFVTRLDAPDILYRNKGDGTFENVSTPAGFTANLQTNAPAWGDIDNDGDLDLYVTSGGDTRFYMYINDGAGNFTEQAVSRGADIGGVSRYGQSVTFGDYDGDGYLDIFTNDWGNEVAVSTSRLLRNLGAANPGYFEDVTAAAGVDVYRSSQFSSGGTDTKTYRFSSTFSDMDRDGNPDLVIAGDFMTSQIFWNNGDGTFTDGTLAAGVGTGEDAMGLTIGDYNGDGELDMFVSNLVDVPGEIDDHSGNRLFLNNGDRTFTDQTDAANVRNTGWSWGTTFLDHDNDGDLDLAVTNGWLTSPVAFVDQNYLLQNDGGVFTDISTASGVVEKQLGRGLLSFDYDQDGDLDIFITNNGQQPILYRNDGGNDNDWLRIEVEGTVSNRDGIGTFITLDPDTNVVGDEMVREIGGGSNFLSQNEFAVHFGLGLNAATIDLITIVWPSGTVQELTNVSVNQLLNLVEVIAGDLDGDGFVGVADLNLVLGNWNQSVPPGNPLADPSGDGFVGIDDLNLVLGNWNVGTPPGAGAVPEPATLGLVALGGVTLLRRRA
jgi:enediyne biosynthesis protein E4